MRIYTYYGGYHFYLPLSDFLIAFVVVVLILLFGAYTRFSKIEKQPIYKYYMNGLLIKLTSGLFFALYFSLFYYDGGDTVSYWYGAEALKNVFYQNPAAYFHELVSEPSIENYFNTFNADTGWPPSSIYRSARHFNTCKIASVGAIIVPGSFLGLSLLLSYISYLGIWRLYKAFVANFPNLEKPLRIGILFLPSTLFWCSGILKDTIVLTGISFIVYQTDLFLNRRVRRNRLRFIFTLILWSYIIYMVKPYVVIALAIAWLTWMNYAVIAGIKNRVLKYYLLPVIVIGSFFFAFRFYLNSSGGGEFAADNIIEKALVSRNDFATNTTYGSNRAEVAVIESFSVGSVLIHIPQALVMGMFRPFLWESRSIAVLMAGLENTLILFYFLRAVWRLRLFGFLNFIKNHPLLLFSMIFTMIMAFIVGFTTPLFGAMVRFRTPFLPFFVSFLIVGVYYIRSLPKGSVKTVIGGRVVKV